MKERRAARLGEEIREQVADIIASRVKDPRVGFVTVTRVDVAQDLSTARVFVSVLGDDEQRKRALAGLKQAAGFVRRELGRRVRVRHTPELLFQADLGIEATDRVARLLEEIGENASSAGPGAEETEPEPGEPHE